MATIVTGASVDAMIRNEQAARKKSEERAEVKARITKVVGNESLADPSSPYSKALDWVMYEDPMQLEPTSPTLVQRFVAVYLYFALTLDGPVRIRSLAPTHGDQFRTRTDSQPYLLISLFSGVAAIHPRILAVGSRIVSGSPVRSMYNHMNVTGLAFHVIRWVRPGKSP